MRLSPADIRQQQFRMRMLRGFDSEEVYAFLEHVAEDYESVIKENALLKEQLAAFEERSRGVTEREKSLQDTLVTTHRLTEEMKMAAKRQADLMLREAQMQGEKFLEDVHGEEAKIRADIQMLKRARRQMLEELRTTLERFQRFFGADLAKSDREDVQ